MWAIGSIVLVCPHLASPLSSCLRPRNLFCITIWTCMSFYTTEPPAQIKLCSVGSKGWTFPFLLGLSEAQNVLLTWNSVVWYFIPIYKENKISNFRTSCNFQYSDVLFSHPFLYNEGNAWVDKRTNHSPESRGASVLWYTIE